MTRQEPATLDDVIAAYLQRIDEGSACDPETFIDAYLEHREGFLKFVTQLDRVKMLASDEVDSNPSVGHGFEIESDLKSRVIGRYELGPMIARGGMSHVYQATDAASGDSVALKLLDSSRILDPSVQDRFRREAKAVELLDHPNIVQLLDWSNHEGVPYLVFPLINGCTLTQLVAAFRRYEDRLQRSSCSEVEVECRMTGQTENANDNTPIAYKSKSFAGDSESYELDAFALRCFEASRQHSDPLKDLALLIADAADALHAAHQHGIVHRDVKPSNLMIDSVGHLWLTDFGLASVRDGESVLTQSGQLVGTPNFMSPEQAGGKSKVVDHRSDVFSLGATLYQLTTLERPFQGERFRVLLDVSRGRLTPPSRIRGDIPRGLETIILKAMALEPVDRYESAAEMADDLRRFASNQSPLARLPGPAEKAMGWLIRNPRTSLTTAGVCLGLTIIVFTLQYASRHQLSKANSRLSVANDRLEETNSKLESANANLDDSRTRLQRHLYIADVAAAYRAYAENEIDNVRQLLARHVPDDSEDASAIDLRGVEWWILHNLTRAPDVVRLCHHEGPARELALVPGTLQGISVGDDGVVRHWDLDERQQINAFALAGKLDAVAISPDGGSFVTSANSPLALNPLAIHDISTGKVIRKLTRHGHTVESVAFSPTSDYVATADRYHNVHLHDINGELVGQVATDSRNESLAFTADGKHLVAVLRTDSDDGGKQSLAVWSVPDLERIVEWDQSFRTSVFALSADGRRVVVAHTQGILVGNWPEREKIFDQHDVLGRIRCLAINQDGSQVAAGCDNGMIHHWTLDSNGKPENEFPRTIVSGEKRVTSIQFADDQTLVSTREDGAVRAWLIGERNQAVLSFGSSTRAIAAPSSETGVLYTRSEFGGIEKLSLDNLRDYHQIAHADNDWRCRMAVTSDGKTVAAAAPDEIVLFSGQDGTEQRSIATGLSAANSCTSLLFTTDDSHLVALYPDRLLRYHTSDGSLTGQVSFHQGGADSMAECPDPSSFVVVTRNALYWLETDSMTVHAIYNAKLGDFVHVSYTPDGETVVVGHGDGSIELLDASELNRIGLLRGHRNQVFGSLFVNDGRTLITCGEDMTVRFWDVHTERELGYLRVREGAVKYLHYDSRQKRLFGFREGYPTKVWSASYP
ncbi:WD40 repeat domain-containing serine/threonine-protein kinase [Stieleria mannarensis]|uniref:WD40 repeat domain-containing serine/threonine-protein kinase n=1 Tax=Stieleria mannarensis TaxID=2755585 RepID=UPI0016030DDB|nr:WD40 repeat domain-containing serine/threonine-protein kinase [Rhodopirellula sp. JC639]